MALLWLEALDLDTEIKQLFLLGKGYQSRSHKQLHGRTMRSSVNRYERREEKKSLIAFGIRRQKASKEGEAESDRLNAKQ